VMGGDGLHRGPLERPGRPMLARLARDPNRGHNPSPSVVLILSLILIPDGWMNYRPMIAPGFPLSPRARSSASSLAPSLPRSLAPSRPPRWRPDPLVSRPSSSSCSFAGKGPRRQASGPKGLLPAFHPSFQVLDPAQQASCPSALHLLRVVLDANKGLLTIRTGITVVVVLYCPTLTSNNWQDSDLCCVT
jgi:hypothetical protein